jgi:hypothetical protein
VSLTGAAPLQPPAPLGDRLAAFLAEHKYYTYRDIVAEVFHGVPDDFVDAWATGVLPHDVRHACEDTLSPEWLQVLLLRRVSRQLSALLAALQ